MLEIIIFLCIQISNMTQHTNTVKRRFLLVTACYYKDNCFVEIAKNVIELELGLAELDCRRHQLVAVVADLVVVPVVVLVVVLVVAVAAEVVVVLAVEPDVDLESAVEIQCVQNRGVALCLAKSSLRKRPQKPLRNLRFSG